MLLQLRQNAHLYVPVESLARGRSTLKWMVLGRHHGLPTRLLDWSYSPSVAAWMACADHPTDDGAVWCVSVSHVDAKGPDGPLPLMEGAGKHLDKIVNGLREHPEILFFTPPVHNQRSALQQGLFSIAADGLGDHDKLLADILSSYPIDPRNTRLRVRIPAGCKRDFIRELRAMNVTAKTLAADLDGFCREMLQVVRDHPEELEFMHKEAIRELERDASAGPHGSVGT